MVHIAFEIGQSFKNGKIGIILLEKKKRRPIFLNQKPVRLSIVVFRALFDRVQAKLANFSVINRSFDNSGSMPINLHPDRFSDVFDLFFEKNRIGIMCS